VKKMSTPPRATALLRAACIHAQRGGALCCRQAVAREADPIPWYPEEADVTDGRLLRWWLWVCNLPRRGGGFGSSQSCAATCGNCARLQ